MQDAYPLIALLAWLQLKHFVADYLLQPDWIIRGKGDLHHPGGYIHAAIHAMGTMPGLILFGVDAAGVAALAAGEFALHFVIDHVKARHSRARPMAMNSRAFWAAHGADQFLHHMTYCGILFLVS